jgi:hypothetical protein
MATHLPLLDPDVAVLAPLGAPGILDREVVHA